MDREIPAVLFLIRSKEKPEFAILCTETHINKWINKILDKGESPQIRSLTREELKHMIKPNPNFN